MSGASTAASACALRAAVAEDLERVIALDRAHSGQSRRGFFEKRWQAQERSPDAFVSIVAEADATIAGYALAHVIDGEFGGEAPAVLLYAIAVDPAASAHGVGSALMQGLVEAVRARGGREIRTQARWDERDLVQFFARSGFRLAPRVVLERSTALPAW